MLRPNWDLAFSRIFFVVLIAAIAAVFQPFSLSPLVAALCGLVAGAVIVAFELRLRRFPLGTLVGGSIGAFLGVSLGLLLVSVLNNGEFFSGATAHFFRLIVPLVFGQIALLLGAANGDRLHLGNVAPSTAPPVDSHRKLLDSSVLIDGRIADVAESGFLDGELVVPEFVLHELQLVADSSESARRNRGRRGLDVVARLQKTPGVRLTVSPQDFPATREVDLKLIEFAKLESAKIVTNDFNLNKLAQVQGLDVLNINELANALRPVVLPGESMRVFILKEGKEHNQGVAYLDDGTMVVVDNARRLISKTIDITVTSVLQTTAGKMIFGKFDERAQPVPETRSAAAGSSS